MDYQNPFVLRAIEHCNGNQSELARRCGEPIRQGHIWKWLHMESLTAEAAAYLERGTGGKLTRVEMRPDIFGPIESSHLGTAPAAEPTRVAS